MTTETQVKERPILFSGEMVLAIKEGDKTQTRRLCKLVNPLSREAASKCPYGRPGDRLWVRESWNLVCGGERYYDSYDYGDVEFFDGSVPKSRPSGWKTTWRADWDCLEGTRWRPSIHMPRWASRLTLEIVRTRLEQLHRITEEDAKAEGVCPEFEMDFADFMSRRPVTESTHRLGFKHLWDRINGKRAPWSSNPWVWVIEFRRDVSNRGESEET